MRLFDFLAPFVPRTRRGVTIRSGAPFPAFSPPSIRRAPRRAPLFSQTIVPADLLARWRSDNAAAWCWRQQSCCKITSAGGGRPPRTTLLRGPDQLLRSRTEEHGVAPKNPLSRLATDQAFQKPGKESEFDRGSLLARAPPERGERHRHRRGTTVGRHRRGCGESLPYLKV